MLPLGLLHLGLSALFFSRVSCSGLLPVVQLDKEFHTQLVAQALPPLDTIYYFDQLIDHNDPSKGTFKQRYWHTVKYYQPGGPIILFNGGEGNAENHTGYLTPKTLTGVLAQRFNGTPIVLEHRFFGLSNPYPNLNEESLQLLTVEQAVEDNVYFAKNVVLPQANATSLTADKAPWILVGGSYPGALVSWTMVRHPDVFWIGYASSAVVQAQLDFWQYFLPIAEHMPRNCSADISAVVQHVDSVFTTGSQDEQKALKKMFGYSASSNSVYLATRLKSDLFSWQKMNPQSGPHSKFHQFCDVLEVKEGGEVAPPTGWGLDHALAAWAKNVTGKAPQLKAENTFSLLGHNDIIVRPTNVSSFAAQSDYPVDDSGRSWKWMLCNELGYSLDGPPQGVVRPIVSRLDTWQYEMGSCSTIFPNSFVSKEKRLPNIAAFNEKYKGWGVNLNRLYFANGRNDPWRELTVSAYNSTAVKDSDTQPIGLSNGFHCSDLVMSAGFADPTVAHVQNRFLEYVHLWLHQWHVRPQSLSAGGNFNGRKGKKGRSARIWRKVPTRQS